MNSLIFSEIVSRLNFSEASINILTSSLPKPLTLHIDTRLFIPEYEISVRDGRPGGSPNVWIDWGDGSPITGPKKHRYTIPSEFTIRVYGGTDQVIRCGSPLLVSVETFGEYNAKGYILSAGISNADRRSMNLISVPDDLPDTVTEMSHMLEGSLISDLSPLEKWNTEKVRLMDHFLQNCVNVTDVSPLEKWNTENVIHMFATFASCTSLEHGDLSGWCVDNFTEEPPYFSDNTPNWNPENHPVWGTCPGRD